MEIDQWEARMANPGTTNRFREFLSRENNTFRILSKNADLHKVPNIGVSPKNSAYNAFFSFFNYKL